METVFYERQQLYFVYVHSLHEYNPSQISTHVLNFCLYIAKLLSHLLA